MTVSVVSFSCSTEDPTAPTTTDDSVIDPADDDPDPDPDPEPADFVVTFGGSLEDSFSDILRATDGNYVLVGATKSMDGDIVDKETTDFDYWVLKELSILDPSIIICEFNSLFGQKKLHEPVPLVL